MANSHTNGNGNGNGEHPCGSSCVCCNDDIRAALLTAARASRLEPTRPSRVNDRKILVDGEPVDIATATIEVLLRAARAVRAQFKEVVAKQRAHLAKVYADSTATDGFRIKAPKPGLGAEARATRGIREASHGA